MKVQPSQWYQSWLFKLLIVIGSGSLLILVSSATIDFWEQRQLQKQQALAWETVQNLEQQGNYDQCVKATGTIASNSGFYAQAQTLKQRCQLLAAQELAEADRLPEAIAQLLTLPPKASQYEQAQKLMQQWSEQIMNKAEALFQAGKLTEAENILRSLPPQAPGAEVAEQFLHQWQTEWERNTSLKQSAEESLAEGQWLAAKETLEKVSSNAYWQAEIKPLLAEAEAGIAEVLRYEQEQQLASTPTPSFYDQFQSLYETFVNEGMVEWEAGVLACETLGGEMVDRGPEVACVP